MTGIKNFVLGFMLSLFSVILFGQLHSSSYSKNTKHIASNIHISLFKKIDTNSHPLFKNSLFANIKKQSLALDIPVTEDQSVSASNEGIEDDEILSIVLDDNIPIEFETSLDKNNETEVLTEDNEEKTAMLPSELLEDETIENTPWVVAKGSPYIKNKRFLSEMEQKPSTNLFTDTIQTAKDERNDLSYKVAEKIKQSIIFPIPNEILNDENLTPTFIHTSKTSTSTPSVTKPEPVKVKIEKKENKKETPVQVTNKETSKEPSSKIKDSNILNSISSWFTDKPAPVQAPAVTEAMQPVKHQKKSAPSYSSQNKSAYTSKQTEDLAKFYKSLQQTREEHIQRNIASLELKLSFQPGRAEISGKTLNWLKIFSEAALQSNTRLQVRLDGSVDTELQKKRLNLLYTIFMNNGVDFKKIDTVFTLTEPNAFIIRTLKTK